MKKENINYFPFENRTKETFFLELFINYIQDVFLDKVSTISSSIIYYNFLSNDVKKEFLDFVKNNIDFFELEEATSKSFLNHFIYDTELQDIITIQAGIYNSNNIEEIKFENFEFENLNELFTFIDIKSSEFDIEPSLAVRTSIDSRVHLLDYSTPVAKKDFFEEIIIENLKNKPMNMQNEIILNPEQINWLFNKKIIDKVFYKEGDEIKQILRKNFFEEFNFFEDNIDFFIEKQSLNNEQLDIINNSLKYFDSLENYEVEIVETLSKIVSVKAESFEQAKERVIQNYNESKIILDSQDFVFNEFKNPKLFELNSEKIKNIFFNQQYPAEKNLKEAQELFSEFDSTEKKLFLEELETLIHYDAKDNDMSDQEIKDAFEKIENDLTGFSAPEKIDLKFYNKKNMEYELETEKNLQYTLRKTNLIKEIQTDFSSANLEEIVNKINSLDELNLDGENKYEFIDKINSIKIIFSSELEKQKILSDIWAAELSKRTNLSFSMTSTQIDEKQALHYRKYETLSKKEGLPINPLLENQILENISEKLSEEYEASAEGFSFNNLDIENDFTDTLIEDIENGNGDLWKKEKYLTTNEIYELIPEERKGDDFHIRVSKEEAEFLVKNDFIDNIMNKEYGDDDDHWVGMTKDDLDEETNRFDDEYQTFEIFLHPATKKQIQTIFNGLKNFENSQALNSEIIGGKIKDIATEAIQNTQSLKQYDQNTQNLINLYINQNPKIMENSTENQEQKQQEQQGLKVGRIASVNTGNGIFKGAIESINGDDVTLKNLKKETVIVKKDDVYQFFHGQKFDYSELSKMIENSKELPEGLSIKDIKGKDLHNLLKGEISEGLLKVEKKDKTMSAEFKLQPLYNSENKQMEVKAIYKNPKELNFNIFGEKASEEQIKKLQEGEKVTIDRNSKNGKEFTAQVYLDKELNQIIFDKFIDKTKEPVQKETTSKKLEFADQFEYENFLTTEVNIFENAKKINSYQLDSIILQLDQNELNEFLIDLEIEENQIDSILQTPDPIKKEETIDSIKNTILNVINSSSEKVDLFKEKFSSVKINQENKENRSQGRKI